MKKEKEVIMNPDLVQALKGFTPVMGVPEDLKIVNSLEKLHKKLRSINNKTFRETVAKKQPLTHSMAEILREEISLIKRIINRNLDF